jgi:EAL domain-containing protein (putative c-di-GMP-specific phosphodiesterase class I)
LSVAVNVSPVQLDFSDMNKIIKQVLGEAGLEANRLHVRADRVELAHQP